MAQYWKPTEDIAKHATFFGNYYKLYSARITKFIRRNNNTNLLLFSHEGNNLHWVCFIAGKCEKVPNELVQLSKPPDKLHETRVSQHFWWQMMTGVVNGPYAALCGTVVESTLSQLPTVLYLKEGSRQNKR